MMSCHIPLAELRSLQALSVAPTAPSRPDPTDAALAVHPHDEPEAENP